MPPTLPAQAPETAAESGGDRPDWRSTLIQEFSECVTVINQQIAQTVITDPVWQRLHDQRQQYWNAISSLQSSLLDTLLTKIPNVTTTLNDAANKAKEAVTRIQTIANAVGLAASLLVLATAIATAATTGNPAGIIPAAQGVVTAAGKIIQPG